ncbi:ATP-binding cassette domain-containing protein [Actinomadura monticuli]|uniref:ATP-binding cassette domain-containing protein n=1 Tax=Actinomadura monticuli TaxID=3097367 RepID=A0ABV4QIY6_9ACTN
MTRLRAEDLTLAYEKRVVAEGLGVEIPDGSFTVIVGPNACGKSTLLRALARLLRPREGTVYLDGEPLLHDLNHACRYATHLIAMRGGEVLAEGPPAEIVTAGLVERVFGLPCRVIPDPETETPLIVPAGRRTLTAKTL